MKQILSILLISITFLSQSQEIKTEERSTAFSTGSKNAILVTIPNVTSDFMEKEIKDEMKNWGGKFSSSKGEFTIIQGQTKEIGEKMFDGYAKIVSSKDGIVVVAFAFDLGGAYLSSIQHKEQYTAINARIKAFAVKVAKDATQEELDEQQKILKSRQKEQEDLEKEKASLDQDIVDYTKKIEDAKKKIEQNKQSQEKKKEEIKVQTSKVEEVSKKLGAIK